MLSAISAAFLMVGAGFTMLAGIGTLRFTDVYARMHPAAKGPTLGLLLVAIGAALELGSTAAIFALVLVVVLQFLSAPLGAHLLGRAIHISLPLGVEMLDELADDLAATPDGAPDASSESGTPGDNEPGQAST